MEDSYSTLINYGYVLDNTGKLEKKDVDLDSINKCGVYAIGIVMSGYGYYDVWRSNLQKCIRRGMVDGAIRSAYEMCSCNKACTSNTVNRLCKVIVSEDIGCSNPFMSKICYSFLNNNFSLDKLYMVIDTMCKSKKSRVCDECIILARKNIKLDNKYVSMAKFIDEELSKDCKETITITINGKRKSKRKNIYKIWRCALIESKKLNSLLYECVVYLFKIFEQHSGSGNILNVINAVFLVEYYRDKKINADFLIASKNWCNNFKIDTYKVNTDIWPLDCSYDKHTVIGKNINRGDNHFFKCGSKLINEDLNLCILDETS